MLKKMRFISGVCLASLIGTCSLVSCSSFFGEEGYSIKSATSETDAEGNTKVTISFTDDAATPITFTIPKAMAGKDGVGIKNITSVIEDNNVVITISYTDSSVEDTIIKVPVNNGTDGKDGKGIKSVDVKLDANKNTVIIFIYTDDTESNPITIPSGNGISGIVTNASADGTFTTVTIKFSDGSDPVSFTIDNGIGISSIVYDDANSTSSEYALKITYSNGSIKIIKLPRPSSTLWYTGSYVPGTQPTAANIGDFYLNTASGEIYKKTSATEWEYLMSIAGTGSGDKFDETYKIKFNFNGGHDSVDTDVTISTVSNIGYGTYLSLDSIPLGVKDSVTFNGWFTTTTPNINSGKFTDLTPVTKDLILYANYI